MAAHFPPFDKVDKPTATEYNYSEDVDKRPRQDSDELHRRLDEAFDEQRADIIGQNSNEGWHYESLYPPQNNFKEIPVKETKVLDTQVGATKYDQGKPPMHLFPLEVMESICKVLGFGAEKYAEDGWKNVPNAEKRYLSALLRHLTAIQKGELVDSDSGLPHIDHVACNAVFLSWFNIQNEKAKEEQK